MILSRLTRVEYLWQPAQLLRRAWRHLLTGPTESRLVVRLPCGFPLEINPHESVGRAILALNVVDLVVTETITRLADTGETCADIGANIGHMTAIMAARVGRNGILYSFEPLPRNAATLRDNVARWTNLPCPTIFLRTEALTDTVGEGTLHLSDNFGQNQGTATLDPEPDSFERTGTQVTVTCQRLDDAVDLNVRFDLIKVDIEGCEPRLFRGAERLLAKGGIRDIVFEEHRPAPAESVQILEKHGYQVYRVVRDRSGPRLLPAAAADPCEYDVPTYLATRDPSRAATRFASPGWQCLRR